MEKPIIFVKAGTRTQVSSVQSKKFCFPGRTTVGMAIYCLWNILEESPLMPRFISEYSPNPESYHWRNYFYTNILKFCLKKKKFVQLIFSKVIQIAFNSLVSLNFRIWLGMLSLSLQTTVKLHMPQRMKMQCINQEQVYFFLCSYGNINLPHHLTAENNVPDGVVEGAGEGSWAMNLII